MRMAMNNNKEIHTDGNITTQNSNDTVDIVSSELVSYNPTLAENECIENDLERLKGDAIGETLYSERFVLKTLLKLGQLDKDLQEMEEVERDLCSLWDMTLEEDVIKYLLNHDILMLFANIIENTDDKRLTEILVGILGNMCNISETRNLLSEKTEVVKVLLDLTSCMDSFTLEQLMRLLAVVFVKMPEDQIAKWYNLILKSDKFVENLCFILNNATNNSLILQTLETLNAILAKFFVLKLSMPTLNGTDEDESNKKSFDELFLQPEVIECTLEAFKTLVKQKDGEQDCYETAEAQESTHKAKQTFCNIHSILTQYQQFSRDAYAASSNNEILICFKYILEPMIEESRLTNWGQYEQDVLETLNDVLRVLPQPFDFEIFKCLLKLLYEVDKQQEKQLKELYKADFESDGDDSAIDYQIAYTLILNNLHYLILKADREILKQYISGCSKNHIENLLKSFKEPLETDYIKNCYKILKEALEE